MSDKVFLIVKDLQKSYGEGGSYTQVLKGVNCKVCKGEMCVIQGTSGSGKSTLLNCIGGLDEIEELILNEYGFVSTTFGSRILRVESVPLFIMSIINYEYMEW